MNAVEVRLHLNRMMDIKHSAAMDTFADLVLDVLRKPEVTLDKVNPQITGDVGGACR